MIALALLASCVFAMGSCTLLGEKDKDIYVQTNAYFAPFEYYDGTEIVGVDIEIM